jgi:NADPH-dependent curcumin reductase CurA
MPTNRQILLKRRPEGLPTQADFELVERPLPEPGDGDVLTRTLFLSLDPYMRGRMSAARSYAKPVEVGGVMGGGTVGEVVASRDPAFKAGDAVLGAGGWQDFAAQPAKGLRKLDPSLAPLSTALGVLGMPGLTAYVGLLDIGQPKTGETVVVSAASGAVGSMVGQLAKLRGCRTVGIAGGPEKCRFVVDQLGFDASVDHRAADFPSALKDACGSGIDIDFENAGGAVLDAVWQRLNDFARVVVCGLIAQYNDTTPAPGPNVQVLLTRRVKMQGFIVSDRLERRDAFLAEIGPLVRAGRIKYKEDMVDGLERAPAALIGLLQGKNFGKVVVRLA